MYKVGRKEEATARSSLIRGGRKTTKTAAWWLVEPRISHGIPILDHRGSNDQANNPLFVKEILSNKTVSIENLNKRGDLVLI